MLERLQREFEAVGFYLSAHPLDQQKAVLNRMQVTLSAALRARLEQAGTARVSMAGVLLKKSEKMSAKTGNKYAFLQISDPSGVFEAMVFSEELARMRDKLVPGTSLWLSVEAELRDDAVRINAQTIQTLDQAVAEQRRSCHVEVKDAAAIPQIRGLIDAEASGGGAGVSRLVFRVPIDGAGVVAQIAVPGFYKLAPATLQAMRRLSGVVGVTEH